MAERYSVSQSIISDIYRHVSWKHVS
jgi:hypothetical protein